jgi:hypothetical protein
MNFLKKAAAEAEALQKKMQQAQQQFAEASLKDGKGAAAAAPAPAAAAPAPLTEEQKAKEKEFDDKAELAIPAMVRSTLAVRCAARQVGERLLTDLCSRNAIAQCCPAAPTSRRAPT